MPPPFSFAFMKGGCSIRCFLLPQVSDVYLQGVAPQIDILSRGGRVTLNLTRSGFSGAFEVHVSYGQISIPGHPLVPPHARYLTQLQVSFCAFQLHAQRCRTQNQRI